MCVPKGSAAVRPGYLYFGPRPRVWPGGTILSGGRPPCARTDAAAVEGIDAAIERAKRYADAGADLLFVEAPASADDVRKVASRLKGHRLVFNWVEGGRTPGLPLDELTDLGFALVLFPIGALLAATRSVREFYGAILRDGTPRAVLGELPPFDEFTSFMGLPEIDDLGQRFAER